MSLPRFWIYLAAVAVGTVIILALLHWILPASDALSPFTMTTTGVFVAIVGLAYVLGDRAAKSSNRYNFVRLVMMLIFVKMMVCVLLVVIHVKTANPESKLFVVPFLMIYLIFTTFEVITMEKLARLEPKK